MTNVLNNYDLDQVQPVIKKDKNIMTLSKLLLQTFYYAKSKNNCNYRCIKRSR